MNTKKLSHPSGIRDWLAAPLSVLCMLAFLSNLQAKPPKNTVVTTVNVGSSPGSLVCSPDSKFVYVSIAGGIAVIDASTNQLSTNFSLPGSQTFLAIAPDGKTLYASASVNTSQGVQVISIANQSVSTTIPFTSPEVITLTPDGSQLWVCDLEVNDSSGGIHVIDTATNTVLGGPIVIDGDFPDALVFTPNGADAYALYFDIMAIPAYLVKINTSTRTVVNQNVANKALHAPPSRPPREPTLLSMDPNGSTIYVWETAEKFWIEAVTLKSQTGKRLSPAGPTNNYCQTMTPNGKYLYIYELNGATNATVNSISTETGEVAGPKVTVGLPNPTSFDLTTIAVAPNGKYAYVSNNGDGTVTVIDIQQ